MDLQRLRVLSPRERALVAIAVLLDGHEAAVVLEQDSGNGAALQRAASALAAQVPDLRMPLCGTVLRMALEEQNGGARTPKSEYD